MLNHTCHSVTPESLEGFLGDEPILTTLLKALPDIFIFTDEEGHILFLNHPKGKLKKGDVIHTDIADFVDEASRQAVVDTLKEVRSSEKTVLCKLLVPDDKSKLHWHESCLIPIKIKNKNFIAISMRDIDAHKRAAEELESANRELQKMVRVMVGREQKIMELKKENGELKGKLNGK